jgi:predicted TIM-barrel fold metal-dependent hydrolase
MRIIDAWVNADLPRSPAPWQLEVAELLFKKTADAIFRKFSAEELIDLMDQSGVETAVLTLQADRPSKTLLGYAEKYPGRFGYSAIVDPRRGIAATRQLQAIVSAHDVRLARVIPSTFNLPPHDRTYYPLYAKCVELGLPVSVNTGIPGPRLPGKCQDPMHLDDVCVFFPELTLIMAHGADPWWDVAIRLMAKYPNLYLMTSAYAPKHLPPALIRFMNGRGGDKVMFATDFPFLEMSRCASEAKELGLHNDVLEAYAYGNAARVLRLGAVSEQVEI